MTELMPAAGQSRGRAFPPVPAGRTMAELEQFWADWEPLIRNVARRRLGRAGVPRSLADVDDVVQQVYLRMREEWASKELADRDPGRYAVGTVLRSYVRDQVSELKQRANRRCRVSRHHPRGGRSSLHICRSIQWITIIIR